MTNLPKTNGVGDGVAHTIVCEDIPDWSVFAWSEPRNIVYGPVSSRRLGRSLGINLFPEGKICGFNCKYCDVDTAPSFTSRPRLVSAESIIETAHGALNRYANGTHDQPDSITFAGNGEPTIHPGFCDIAKAVSELRNVALPNVPLNIFTDGMHIGNSRVRSALELFRRAFLKLDGASEHIVDQINGRGAWSATRAGLEWHRQLTNVSTSTAVITGPYSNIEDVCSRVFVEVVNYLGPREVYLYTIDYPSPNRTVEPVDMETLVGTANWLAQRVARPVIALWRKFRHPSVVRAKVNTYGS